MRNETRGHALLLLLAVGMAVLTVGVLVNQRIDGDLEAARSDEQRLQALWLARSAVAHLRPGDREVAVHGGKAKVRVTPGAGRVVEATVVLPDGSTARVQAQLGPDGVAASWQERFERAGRL
jgi:hypothetical protein